MNGGFLPRLFGAIGTLLIPSVLGAIPSNAGLQIDSRQRLKGCLQIDSRPRPYRRIPRIKRLIPLKNKPINNLDINLWVNELRLKHFDGVFNKANVNNKICRIINLDDPHGPGIHWTCYINSMYFDSFGLPPPENLNFIKRYNILQYQDPKSVLCGNYCLSFFKKYQERN